jgi:hypothetical protein
MKGEIKQLFEMITLRIIKLFLSQRPQNAPPFPAPALPNPQILLSDYPGTNLTWRNFSWFLPLLFPEILHTTYEILSSSLPPILHANHPILRGSHPILLSSHPILCGNHPVFSAWGPHLPVLSTLKVPRWQVSR